MSSFRFDQNSDGLVTSPEPMEECPSCNEEITYEDIVDGKDLFFTIDDCIFHTDCWEAWVDSGEGRNV